MYKKFAVTGIILTICFSIWTCSHAADVSNQPKPVVKQVADYLQYEIEQLTEEATVVAHGVVRSRGETRIVRIPISTEIDVTKENEGKFLESVETPITIAVTDSIKGAEKGSTLMYMEEGGELDDRIVEADGGSLREGDEVVIFLNEAGHSWGSQGVLRVVDGIVVVIENNQQITYGIESLITKLNSASGSGRRKPS